MGNGIGTRLITGRHTLEILDIDREKVNALVAELGASAQAGDSITGEVVVFALPYSAIPQVIEQYRDQLAEKIIVDVSNPVDLQTFELVSPADSSGVEAIASLLPGSSRVVKAFNTTFAGTLVRGEVDGKKLDVFIASDEEAAKTIVKLAEDGGLRGLYVGKLNEARALEGMQILHMAQQETLGTNWMSSLKLLP